MGCLQLLKSFKVNIKPTTNDESLMFMEVKVNGKKIDMIVDSGASQKFIRKEKAARLGILLKKGQEWLKMVNSKVKPLDGIARGVKLQPGTWKGKVDFSVTPYE